MEKIAHEDPNATKLLNICSFLAPDNIPEVFLEAWLKDKNQNDSGLDFQDALSILENYSLIDQKIVYNVGSQKKLISIHRLIQAVTRDQCKEEEAKRAIQLGIDVLNRQFKGDVGSKEEREGGAALVGHAQAIIAHAEEGKMITEKVWSLTDKIGIFLWRTGDLALAKEMHQKALKIRIACLGTEEHTSVAISYTNLGDVYLLLKENKQAREHYLKAKQIYQKTVGDKYNAFYDGKIKECGNGNAMLSADEKVESQAVREPQ